MTTNREAFEVWVKNCVRDPQLPRNIDAAFSAGWHAATKHQRELCLKVANEVVANYYDKTIEAIVDEILSE